MRELSGALDKDKATPDYLEATIYNKEEAVIMVGNFSDVPPGEENKVSLRGLFSLSHTKMYVECW